MSRAPLPIEKDHLWYVIVVADSQGRTTASVWRGRDPEDAVADMERRHPDLGSRWLVHWERGFRTRDEAEARAAGIRTEVGADAPDTSAGSKPQRH